MPDSISDSTRDTAEARAREVVVLALWEAGEVSTRQAADELGLTYRDFLDLLSARGIPVEDSFDREALQKARETLRPGTPG
jgi:predicted HTH domain antitoxin